jgi:hypothetical protein
MDRRLAERHPVHFQATITPLARREQSMRGVVHDISTDGMCAMLPRQLAPGEQLQLDMADSLLFGHVIFCKPESGEFRTGIEVERVLLGETDLSHILQNVLATHLPALIP